MPRSSQGQPGKGNNTHVNPPSISEEAKRRFLLVKDIPGKLRIARSTSTANNFAVTAFLLHVTRD